MVAPIPTYISLERLERLERLEELADASRLRAALYPAPKPPHVRRRSRTWQFPGGRPPAWGPARPRRRRG
ncbi:MULTISPECIES: hypothetical protein [unclassified Streptomyces]|uniref:hypothetical protein n=1 Tax=unclassified Streptomyces TaxID=2593676 RepID=UPI000938E0F7|nr:hypothetical protein [Streptomyces sp. TSRI0281]OKI40779.1 hypothetical protein A6A29_38765 [Streptomyces sp. TSRI0281]